MCFGILSRMKWNRMGKKAIHYLLLKASIWKKIGGYFKRGKLISPPLIKARKVEILIILGQKCISMVQNGKTRKKTLSRNLSFDCSQIELCTYQNQSFVLTKQHVILLLYKKTLFITKGTILFVFPLFNSRNYKDRLRGML